MQTHQERRVLPYLPREMFALVADIERYPEFLPWCIAARIRSRQGNMIIADLVIGHSFIRERFTSRVTLYPPEDEKSEGRIDVEYIEGPLERLSNRWIFRPVALDGSKGGSEATDIDFYVEFKFRSKMLEKLMGLLFHEAVTRMVRAFETRAAAILKKSA
jgi:coenzyme Q-binding protein COQ10